MENYAECLSRMTNDELLNEFIELNQYYNYHEDMPSDEVKDQMRVYCRTEVLNRMK